MAGGGELENTYEARVEKEVPQRMDALFSSAKQNITPKEFAGGCVATSLSKPLQSFSNIVAPNESSNVAASLKNGLVSDTSKIQKDRGPASKLYYRHIYYPRPSDRIYSTFDNEFHRIGLAAVIDSAWNGPLPLVGEPSRRPYACFQ